MGGAALNFIFAETLRKLREERGLSQKQLGQQMFVNHSTIARWENASRIDLCRTLLEINPRTNIVFLTAYADYSLDAWQTEASGVIFFLIILECLFLSMPLIVILLLNLAGVIRCRGQRPGYSF